ncbi:hypothetical protein ACKWTF_010604 [Chironomus riparius]
MVVERHLWGQQQKKIIGIAESRGSNFFVLAHLTARKLLYTKKNKGLSMKSMLDIFHIAVVRFIYLLLLVLNNDNNINVISISGRHEDADGCEYIQTTETSTCRTLDGGKY